MIPSRLVRICLLSFALSATVPVLAVPLAELGAEDLVPMAGEVRKMLQLNPNQQTLWSQVETRARGILRERQHRREALQEGAKALLARPNAELRDLDREVEAEQAASMAENRQLRAMWLEVNDALDDAQRRQVAGLLGEQLMRVVPEGRPGGGPERGARGERGQERGGHGMGHGRGGMGGGPGGAALNIGG